MHHCCLISVTLIKLRKSFSLKAFSCNNWLCLAETSEFYQCRFDSGVFWRLTLDYLMMIQDLLSIWLFGHLVWHQLIEIDSDFVKFQSFFILGCNYWYSRWLIDWFAFSLFNWSVEVEENLLSLVFNLLNDLKNFKICSFTHFVFPTIFIRILEILFVSAVSKIWCF